MIELPIAEVDGVTAKPCIRSGFCCRQAVCPFGIWNGKQCQYLVGEEGNHECEIAEWIVTQQGWQLAPAFGAGLRQLN